MTVKMTSAMFSAVGAVLFLSGALLPSSAISQDMVVTKVQLKQLSITVAPVTSVDTYAGSKLNASVSALSGQAYTLSSPINVQRVTFLKQRGERVAAGEPLVVLIGSEVEHFYDEYQLKTALFAQTSQLYKSNQKLYEKKAISEQLWLSISENYVTRKLALGEYTHFFDYVDNYNDEKQSLTLKSPLSGVLHYEAFASLNAEQGIARIIPDQAIRLKVQMPASQTHIPSLLNLPQCKLKVDEIEGLSQSFYKTLWSEPLKQSCELRYGDIVTVTPQFDISAFVVPKTAVFSLHGSHYIMLQKGDIFAAVEINIVASEQSDMVVTSQQAINGAFVATSSVSALQGILMGLGE